MKNWKPALLSIAIGIGWSVEKAQAFDTTPTFATTDVVEYAEQESLRRLLGVLAAKEMATLSTSGLSAKPNSPTQNRG